MTEQSVAVGGGYGLTWSGSEAVVGVALLRPLPVTVAPAHRETLDSYVARLAAANGMDRALLRAHIAADPRRGTALPVARLAVVSGRTSEVLVQAIPELELSARPARVVRGALAVRYGSPRRECRRCAVARGRPQPATVHAGHHEAVCRTHRLWLGDGYVDDRGGQPDLSRQLAIVRANVAHRRLVCRHGSGRVVRAYREAAWVCQRWHEYHDHDDEFVELLTGFHGPGWNLASTDPSIQAARYPQIVALTRLLASPYWRARAQASNPTGFVVEVRRTVASRYVWTLASSYRRFDPLVQTLGHRLRPDLPGLEEP